MQVQSLNSESVLTRAFLRGAQPAPQPATLSSAHSDPICSHDVIPQWGRAVRCRRYGLREAERFAQGHTENVCEFALTDTLQTAPRRAGHLGGPSLEADIQVLQSAEVRWGWWSWLACSGSGLKPGFTPSLDEPRLPLPPPLWRL